MKKLEAQQNVGLVPRPTDMSRDLTLRNAGENKRLKGRLQQYDAQLRHSMVSLQAEIMELKASPYAQSATERLRAVQRQALLNNERGNGEMLRERALIERARSNGRLALTPTPVRRNKPRIQLKSPAGELVLPDINPDNTTLISQGATRSPRHSLQPSSGGLLHAPTPPSIYRPRSLPDLDRVDGELGPPRSPRTRRKVKPPVSRIQSVDDRENDRKRVTNEDLKDKVNAFINSSQPSSLDIEVTPPDTPGTENGEVLVTTTGDEIRASESVADGQMSDKELALFQNSLLLKASSSDGLSASMPDLASIGFMDFNEVIDKRLRQSQEQPPSEEEMRKVRYLRWREEPKAPDILSVFEKTPTDTDGGDLKTSPRQRKAKNMQKLEA